MILGVDAGNYNFKTSEGVTFQSKLCKNKKLISKRATDDENLVEFENKKYLIGDGEFQTDQNKLDKELYKICFLKALANSSNDLEFNAVTGLPDSQYNTKNKDRIKNELLSERIYKVKVRGVQRTLILKDIEIFTEAAGAYYGMTKEQKEQTKFSDLILVNIGGGNTNVAYFKDNKGKKKLTKSSTIMNGMLNFYSDFINAVNGEFAINKTLEDAADILTYGIEIYGEKQDLSFTKDIILEHTDRIFKEINLYPSKTSKVMFTGGGCKTLKGLLQKRLKNCLFQTNYLMANAEGFKKVGETLWLKRY